MQKNQKMKKITILTLFGIFLIASMQQLNPSSAFETSSETQLSLELSSDNFEMLGQMASITTYDNYAETSINEETIIHDLTRISVDNLQSFSNGETEISYNNSVQTSALLQHEFPEFSVSAPLDSRFQLQIQANSTNSNVSTSYGIETGSVKTGTLANTYITDDSAFQLEGNTYSSTAISYTLNANPTGSLSDTYVLDESYLWGGGAMTVFMFDFPGSFSQNAEYHIEVGYMNEGTLNTLMYPLDNDGVSGIVSTDPISHHTGYFDVTTTMNGVSKVVVRSYNTLWIDYVHVEMKKSDFLGNFSLAIPQTTQLGNTSVSIECKIKASNSGTLLLNQNSYDLTTDYQSIIMDISDDYAVNQNFTMLVAFASDSYSVESISIDSLLWYPSLIPINVTVNFDYEINGIVHHANILTHFNSYVGNLTNYNLTYTFDTTQFPDYDYVNDLLIPSQKFVYNLTGVAGMIFSCASYTTYSFNNWIVPSSVNLRINGELVTDETYNSGFYTTISYPSQIAFTADSNNLMFNYSLSSIFTYAFDLDVISHSYLSKTLTLESEHTLTITRVQYLFSSDIKHSYLNNIDYSTFKSISPSYSWIPTSTLKIEVILDDEFYLPLDHVNLFSNQSCSLILLAQSNYLNYQNLGTQSLNFAIPLNWQVHNAYLEFSNINYLEPYVRGDISRFNEYYETQNPLSPTITQYGTQLENYVHSENSSYSETHESQFLLTPTVNASTNSYTNLSLSTLMDGNITANSASPRGIIPTEQMYTSSYNVSRTTNIVSSQMQVNDIQTNTTYSQNMTHYYNATFPCESSEEFKDWTSSGDLSIINTINFTSNDSHSIYETIQSSSLSYKYYTIPHVTSLSLEFYWKQIGALSENVRGIIIRTNTNDYYFGGLLIGGVTPGWNIMRSDGSASNIYSQAPNATWQHILFDVQSMNSRIYVDNLLVKESALMTIDSYIYGIGVISSDGQFAIDAFDFNVTDSGYYLHRNQQEIAVKAQTGHFQGYESFDLLYPNRKYENSYGYGSNYIVNEFKSHSKVLRQWKYSTNEYAASVNWVDAPNISENGSIDSYIYVESAWIFMLFCDSVNGWSHGLLLFTTHAYAWDHEGDSSCVVDSTWQINEWNHVRLTWDYSENNYNAFINGILVYSWNSLTTTNFADITYQRITFDSESTTVNHISYIDAVDFSSAAGYYNNRNMNLNYSNDLACWDANPTWDSGYYRYAESINGSISGTPTITQIDSFANHNDVIEFVSDATNEAIIISDLSGTHTYLSFWIYPKQTNAWISIDATTNIGYAFGLGFRHTGVISYLAGGTTWTDTTTTYSTCWYHVMIEFLAGTYANYYLDGALLATDNTVKDSSILAYTGRILADYQNPAFYLDSIIVANSFSDVMKNLLENITISPTHNIYALNEGFYNYKYILTNSSGSSFFSDEFQFYLFTNFSVAPNLDVSYPSITQVGNSALIQITTSQTVFSIVQIKIWDSLSNSETILGSTPGTYYSTLISSISLYYSIEVSIQDSRGWWRKMRVDNLFFAKNATYLTIQNLQQQYFQTQSVNFISRVYQPTQESHELEQSKTTSIYYPNSALYTTSISSNVVFDIALMPCGWYRVNIAFAGSEQYLASSMETVFEILPATLPSLTLTYPNTIHVGETATISMNSLKTLNLISSVSFYDNLTTNTIVEATQNLTQSVSNAISQYYSIQTTVTDTYGLTYTIRVDNLFIAKNLTFLSLSNLKNIYYQNSTLNITGVVRQQNYLVLENTTISIIAPNSTLLQTDINSSVRILDFAHSAGYYILNFTYPGSAQFLSSSLETVFELLPTSRTIGDSVIVNINANSLSPIANELSLTNLGTNFNIAFTCDAGTTFDLEIYFDLNYTSTHAFTALNQAQFQFNANSNLSTITIQNSSVVNYPTDFVYYYYNSIISNNYSIVDSTMYLYDMIGDTFVNKDDFYFGFSIETSAQFIQLDSAITTNVTSIHMREYLNANRTFSHYYFNSNYTVNDVSLTHMRTGTSESLTLNEENYYLIDYAILAGDLFHADFDLDPEFNVQFEVLNSTALNTTVSITVSSAFYIENVSVVIALPSYFPFWSRGMMNLNNVFTFDLNSTSTTSQTFVITGWNLNFTHNYVIMSNSSYIRIEYDVISHANLTDQLDSITLNYYYEAWDSNWISVSQDYESKTLRLTIPQINQTRLSVVIEGHQFNFNVNYSISSNASYIRIEYWAFAYHSLESKAQTIGLNNYYESWKCNNLSIDQDYDTRSLSFTLISINQTIQRYLFEGYQYNFNANYTIQSNSSYVIIEYSVFAYDALTNILESISLNYYYESWKCVNLTISQDYDSRALSFMLTSVSATIQRYVFEGFQYNFNANYSIQSNSSYVRIEYSVYAHDPLTDVPVSIPLNYYYESWKCANLTIDQDHDSRALSFTLNSVSLTIQHYIIEGYQYNFNANYTVFSNSSYIRISYNAFSHDPLTDKSESIALNMYYGVWVCANLSISQSYDSNVLSFTLPSVDESVQYYILEGFITDVFSAYQIIFTNGTLTEIEYNLTSYLAQANYAITLELASNDIYQENWTYLIGALTTSNTTNLNISISQNLYSKRLTCTISNFQNFLSFTMIGNSSVPHALLDPNRYVMASNLDISMNLNVTYYGYLNYSKYSTHWMIDLESDWILDGVHYQNNSYDILPSGYFVSPGWGSSISSSYLKFNCNPILNITRIESGNYIYIIITSSLPVNSANYLLWVNCEESYKLLCNYTTLTITSDYVYIQGINLQPGENLLIFEIQKVDLGRNFWYLFPIIAIAIGYVGYYAYKKYWVNKPKLPKSSTVSDEKKNEIKIKKGAK